MSLDFDVVVVGGGHAGAQAAIGLRHNGFGGTIAVVTEEAELPYERPPLSKEYLSGEKSFDRILLRPATFWGQREIDMLLARRVVGVDPIRRRVTDHSGVQIGFDKLVWTTGGHARRLACEGWELEGVHTVRSRADVDHLEQELAQAQRVAIVGGGYIGLEVAAALVKRGKTLTVLEAQDRVLARVAGEALSLFYQDEHRAHGVDIRLGAVVDRLLSKDGRVAGVRLSDGQELPTDMVVVGIGIAPAVEPLLAAGAKGANGVDVDEFCRTSVDGVYAAGDCAAHINAFAGGRRIRLESVQNANDQAGCVVRHILGQPEPYSAVPWFWSNQYDLRLQTVGLSIGHDEVVIRGSPADRSFSVIYLRDGRVIALDCVNATKDFVQGRALVANASAVARGILADPGIPLKSATRI